MKDLNVYLTLVVDQWQFIVKGALRCRLWLSGSVSILAAFFLCSCTSTSNINERITSDSERLSCSSHLPSRLQITGRDSVKQGNKETSHEDMVWVEGGTYTMGASAGEGNSDEQPRHQVKLKGFWMDKTEVTNKQFNAFVAATHYVTMAEKA